MRALDAAHGAQGAAPRRAILIRLEGVAALLMRAGLAYDSDEGRALIAGIAALAHAAAISESAALAASQRRVSRIGARAKRGEESRRQSRARRRASA